MRKVQSLDVFLDNLYLQIYTICLASHRYHRLDVYPSLQVLPRHDSETCFQRPQP